MQSRHLRSVTTTAGRSRSACSAASAPSRACRTSKPAPRRVRARIARVIRCRRRPGPARSSPSSAPQTGQRQRQLAWRQGQLGRTPVEGRLRHAEDDGAGLVLHQGDTPQPRARAPRRRRSPSPSSAPPPPRARRLRAQEAKRLVGRRAVPAPGRRLGVKPQHAAGLRRRGRRPARSGPLPASAPRRPGPGGRRARSSLFSHSAKPSSKSGRDVLDDGDAGRHLGGEGLQQLAQGGRARRSRRRSRPSGPTPAPGGEVRHGPGDGTSAAGWEAAGRASRAPEVESCAPRCALAGPPAGSRRSWASWRQLSASSGLGRTSTTPRRRASKAISTWFRLARERDDDGRRLHGQGSRRWRRSRRAPASPVHQDDVWPRPTPPRPPDAHSPLPRT